jgi:Protein RETICULATA-related
VLRVEAWPLVGSLVGRWPALRNRLVANARFPMQLGVELSVGVVTKTLAEVSMRGDRFWKEFDLYTSDLALEVVGDTMLVWLLSPAAMFAAPSRPHSVSGTSLDPSPEAWPCRRP